MLEVGQAFGLHAMRVPYEPPLVSWRASRQRLGGRLAGTLGLAPWTSLLKARLRHAGIKSNDVLFGLHDTGAMDEATVLHLLGIDHERLTHYHNGIRRRLTNVHGHVVRGILA